jgi:hypothetical protein
MFVLAEADDSMRKVTQHFGWWRAVSGVSLVLLIGALSNLPVTVGAQDALAPETLASYTERVPTGFINWGAGYAEVEVEAPYETQRFGSSHAKIRAIEAAQKRADEAFYRLLRGVNVTGSERLAGNTALEEALRRFASRERKLTNQRTTNVTMTATFKVPLYGRKALAYDVYRAAWESPETGALAVTEGGEFTSVVLDASETTLQAALFPRILAEGGEILFAPGNVDRKRLERGSPVTYVVRSDNPGKKSGLPKSVRRDMGDNPLVIKVERISGEFLADIVLRPEQEQRLREANVGDLLAQGRVFIVQTASVDLTQS